MPSKSSSSHSRWCDCPPTHRHAVYARWEPDDPGSPLLPITWCTRCHRLHGLSEFRKAVGLQGGERWITVHPGGGEEGNPVLIKPNPDGTHTIIGGAKGALNGLRLTAIKRQSEYQQEAKARHQEKRAAAKQADAARWAEHQQQATAEGKAPEAAAKEADKRLAAEKQRRATAEKQAQAAVSKQQQAAEAKQVAQVAQTLGWTPEAVAVPVAALDKARVEVANATREQLTKAAEAKAEGKPLTGKQRDAIARKAEAQGEKVAAAMERQAHQAVVSKVREAAHTARKVILTVHDDAAARDLGDAPLGDLVRETMGDTGAGYRANLEAMARERGLNIEQAAGSEPRSGGVLEEAKRRLQEAGVAAAIDALAADPATLNVAAAAKVAKADVQIAAVQKQARLARAAAASETQVERVPTSAVITASPLSDEEAAAGVEADLAEEGRRDAMRGILTTVHDLEEDAPIHSHRLAGRQALFNEVAGTLLGESAVDPVLPDSLGEWATAWVMAKALQHSASPARFAAITRALRAQHVETQVQAAGEATTRANELMNAAENLEILPVDTAESFLAARSTNEAKLEMVKEARRVAATALGRLEAAAALNEVLAGNRESITISLGEMSRGDALKRVFAVGLTRPHEVGRNEEEGPAPEGTDCILTTDGRNRFLRILPAGREAMASRMWVDPREAKLRQDILGIQRGEQDEPGWLPAGVARRPKPPSFEYDPERPKPEALQVRVGAMDGPEEMQAALQASIGARMEAGYAPEVIASDIRSAGFATAAGVTSQNQADWDAALNEVSPVFASSGKGAEFGKAAKAFAQAQAARFQGFHAARLQQAGQDAINAQSLPDTPGASDLAYQVVTRDPALEYAFSDVGDLDREGRQAVREWARANLFQSKATDAQDPLNIEGENAAAKKAVWEAWREKLGRGLPAYQKIQRAWRAAAEKDAAEGGGMFGPAEPEIHYAAAVDLGNDAAVLAAARAHAEDLGFAVLERRAVEHGVAHAAGAETAAAEARQALAAGSERRVALDLYPTETRDVAACARKAREALQQKLRQHAFAGPLFGDAITKLAPSGRLGAEFDPDAVVTADAKGATGVTWSHYVQGFALGPEGERRAYQTVLEKMKGEFSGRYSAALERQEGVKLQRQAKVLTYAQEHANRVMTPEQRAAKRSEAASLADVARNRQGGQYAAGSVGAGVQDVAAAQASRQGSLGSRHEGRSASLDLDTTRQTLGSRAEAQLAALVPHLGLRHPAPAADADMSTGDAVFRQRFLKQFDRAHRIGNSEGVGSGKTLMALAGYAEQHAKGNVKRALMAVPAKVVDNFATDAVRFLDPAAGHVFANPGASRADRHAAYADAGTGVVVVTHQALRDDLIGALAEHRFNGSEKDAEHFLATAPRQEREAQLRQAMDSKGWQFDMSAIDEGHNLLDRRGKTPSSLANAIDAFTGQTKYHMAMSADPIRNDASEAFSLLQKLRPDRYNDATKAAFLRKFATGTPAARKALALEMAPYHYAEKIDPGVGSSEQTHNIDLTPSQQKEYGRIDALYQQARASRVRGKVDVDAIRELSPGSFEGVPEEEHQARAERLSRSLGILRDGARDRVVNTHPNGAKLSKVLELVGSPAEAANRPTIIFSRRLEAVGQIAQALKAQGHRVTVLQGGSGGKEAANAVQGFAPTGGGAAAKSDVIVCSDAGAVGVNLQRGNRVINTDTPWTAMLQEQRVGRALRVGQKHAVETHNIRTNTPYEARRLQVLEDKRGLRQTLTTPSELLDDTGLAARVAREEEAQRQGAFTQPAEALPEAA